MGKITEIYSPAVDVEDEAPGAGMGYGEDTQPAIEVVEQEEAEEMEDGEVVDLGGGDIANEIGAMLAQTGVRFDANLSPYMDESERRKLSDQLLLEYDTDLRSRSEWEETYRDGLDTLGLKIEHRTCPWDGAFGAHHPLLAEAVVKFQSETIVETFPAQGPVKTKILGVETPELEAAAARVREDMNDMLTNRMPEYRPEHEKMLWSLPIAGSAFKKVYYCPLKKRAVTDFIPAEKFVVSYGATDLLSAQRYTHRMKKTKNEVLKLQQNEFYDPDIELEDPTYSAEADDIEEAKSKFTGMDDIEDDRYTFLEMHVDIDLNGFEYVDEEGEATGLELPYVVTIDKVSGEILAIYRNYDEEDVEYTKRLHFTHYQYIPGFGFYGFGLIHLIGGFAKGATSIMRQLVDAGTLNNLPGGFKTRGFRIHGGDTPIAPGEFRDTDVATGTLKENIMPLPFKEPSIVLFELLKAIVDEGRRFAAVSDVNIADMQPNAPVGSTLAILERTLKTMTAVQARIHATMKVEFKIIKDIVAAVAPVDYAYTPVGEPQPVGGARQRDFDMVELVPVSDPNASTMSQRIVMYQAALQLMQLKPDIYDQPFLHRAMLETLGIKDVLKLVPDKSKVPPADPVTENMNIINGAPVQAVQHQNHAAHLAVHNNFMQDPQIMGMIQTQGPGGNAKVAAMTAHINEHIAFEYRTKIEEMMGKQLPPPSQALPPEQENQLSQMLAEASHKLKAKAEQEAKMEQAKQAAEDPQMQMQQRELAVKEGDLERKSKKDQLDHIEGMKSIEVDAYKATAGEESDRKKLVASVEQVRTDDQFRREQTDATTAAQRRGQDITATTQRRGQDLQKQAADKAAQTAKAAQQTAKPSANNREGKDD